MVIQLVYLIFGFHYVCSILLIFGFSFDLIFLLAARGSLLGVAWAGPFAKLFLFNFSFFR